MRFREQSAKDTRPQAFDVVPIHPSGPLETDGFGASEDQFHAVGPLRMLIMQAYFLSAFWVQDQGRLKNAPQRVEGERYTFVGRVASSDLAAWRTARRSWGFTEPNLIQNMLRTALEDRCRLVVHRIPGQAYGLQLVIDKHGPNFKTLVSAEPDDAILAGALAIVGDGRMVLMSVGGSRKVAIYRTSMAALAGHLSATLGTHVEDETNLKGEYNFVLTQWGSDPNDLTGLFDFGALGLKLERANSRLVTGNRSSIGRNPFLRVLFLNGP